MFLPVLLYYMCCELIILPELSPLGNGKAISQIKNFCFTQRLLTKRDPIGVLLLLLGGHVERLHSTSTN